MPVVGRYVDGLVRSLIAPLLDPKVARSGWRLAGWDAEQGISLTMERAGAVVLIELERRDDAVDCYARTARFNVCARRQFDAPDLAPVDRAMVDSVVTMLRAREGRLPEVERAQTSRGAELRLVHTERVLISEGKGHYYINPYVGCTIGCDFCYAAVRADFSRALEGLPEHTWGRWVDVKVNAAEVLREEVKHAPPGIVRFSPIVTDPYQPAERRFRITRQCLGVLLEAGFTPVILTRAARVADDLELLARFPQAAIGLSIPTDDDAMREIFEPGGDPIGDRLAVLRQARALGVHTFAVVQPMLPMDPDKLVDELAPWISAVRIDRMHFPERSRHLYQEHGLAHAMAPEFFVDLAARLRAGFRARGIPEDELDDLAGLVHARPNRPPPAR
jgi:DNA repair photolyase